MRNIGRRIIFFCQKKKISNKEWLIKQYCYYYCTILLRLINIFAEEYLEGLVILWTWNRYIGSDLGTWKVTLHRQLSYAKDTANFCGDVVIMTLQQREAPKLTTTYFTASNEIVAGYIYIFYLKLYKLKLNLFVLKSARRQIWFSFKKSSSTSPIFEQKKKHLL